MRANTGGRISFVVFTLVCLAAAGLLTGVFIVSDADYAAAGTASVPKVEQCGSNRVRNADAFAAIPAMTITRSTDRAPALQLAQTGDATAVILARREEIYNDPEAPIAGNPQGDVTIVEFFDYNCPYCRQVASTLEDLVQSDPNIRIVYKEFPILGPNSTFASRAALAARAQGKYLEFHNAVMTGRRVADEAAVLGFARTVGLDVDRLKADMEDPAISAILERNLSLADALQLTGTPSFVIADELYFGAAELPDFQRMIAAARRSSDAGQ